MYVSMYHDEAQQSVCGANGMSAALVHWRRGTEAALRVWRSTDDSRAITAQLLLHVLQDELVKLGLVAEDAAKSPDNLLRWAEFAEELRWAEQNPSDPLAALERVLRFWIGCTQQALLFDEPLTLVPSATK